MAVEKRPERLELLGPGLFQVARPDLDGHGPLPRDAVPVARGGPPGEGGPRGDAGREEEGRGVGAGRPGNKVLERQEGRRRSSARGTGRRRGRGREGGLDSRSHLGSAQRPRRKLDGRRREGPGFREGRERRRRTRGRSEGGGERGGGRVRQGAEAAPAEQEREVEEPQPCPPPPRRIASLVLLSSLLFLFFLFFFGIGLEQACERVGVAPGRGNGVPGTAVEALVGSRRRRCCCCSSCSGGGGGGQSVLVVVSVLAGARAAAFLLPPILLLPTDRGIDGSLQHPRDDAPAAGDDVREEFRQAAVGGRRSQGPRDPQRHLRLFFSFSVRFFFLFFSLVRAPEGSVELPEVFHLLDRRESADELKESLSVSGFSFQIREEDEEKA